MLDRVAATIERHRMLTPRDRVGVAVSGGADSVCLLDVLLALAPRWDLSLSVLHVNHLLRGAESDADEEFVRNLAARLGLPFSSLAVEVAAQPDNLEQAARRARLDFFWDQLAAGAVNKVALGHTRSDQAETVLFRLLRGSGSAGLAGIRPVAGGGALVRPLIDVERGDVLMYLGERGIAWREDSTNRNPAFARNRIRHQLLPELTREWNPGIVGILAQTADWAREEEQYWNREIERIGETVWRVERGAVVVDIGRLEAHPVAVRRRLVRRAIELTRGDLRAVDFGHVESILSLASGSEGHRRAQAPGVDAIRSFDRLRIATPGTYPGLANSYSLDLAVPGEVGIPGEETRITTELIDNSETKEKGEDVYNGGKGGLDWEKLSGPLRLRNWRPGDSYRPAGHGAVRKLKDLFQEHRIPLWERRSWPVIDAMDGIVWSRRFGPAARCLVDPGTGIVLAIREEHTGSGIGMGSRSV
ncbi:MAG: tRNA lysidine(34) synthetase TilS [Acidobacteria bacterium]|nr:tRNA lysidine(34) synthetase TilS [Acidobacteriota bacterium]